MESEATSVGVDGFVDCFHTRAELSVVFGEVGSSMRCRELFVNL
jgi:hypothetical protein